MDPPVYHGDNHAGNVGFNEEKYHVSYVAGNLHFEFDCKFKTKIFDFGLSGFGDYSNKTSEKERAFNLVAEFNSNKSLGVESC